MGYWRLGDLNDEEVPSAIPGGYSARAVGDLSVRTIPPITRFLVFGQLVAAAKETYQVAESAFLAGEYGGAVIEFERVLDLVPAFEGAQERLEESRVQWNLVEAEKAYAVGLSEKESGQFARAYWAYGNALKKVADYKDAVRKQADALDQATYKVGLFVFSSSKVGEALTPETNPSGGRISQMLSSVSRLGRKSLINTSAISSYQDHGYRILEDVLDANRAPYIRLRRRGEMRRLLEQAGATAIHAHYDQVVSAASKAGISVLVLAEFTEAYTTLEKKESNLILWTTKRVEYTDENGKKRKKEVEKKSYTTKRHWVENEMSCRLNYRILNTTTGAIVGEGSLEASDEDAVDFINWNRFDGVDVRDLRVRDGVKFKRLSSDVTKATDARSTLKSDSEMYRSGAAYIADTLAGRLLDTLTYYSPISR